MNKLKPQIDPETIEIISGFIIVLLAFFIFYKVMWIAGAIGLLN